MNLGLTHTKICYLHSGRIHSVLVYYIKKNIVNFEVQVSDTMIMNLFNPCNILAEEVSCPSFISSDSSCTLILDQIVKQTLCYSEIGCKVNVRRSVMIFFFPHDIRVVSNCIHYIIFFLKLFNVFDFRNLINLIWFLEDEKLLHVFYNVASVNNVTCWKV